MNAKCKTFTYNVYESENLTNIELVDRFLLFHIISTLRTGRQALRHHTSTITTAQFHTTITTSFIITLSRHRRAAHTTTQYLLHVNWMVLDLILALLTLSHLRPIQQKLSIYPLQSLLPGHQGQVHYQDLVPYLIGKTIIMQVLQNTGRGGASIAVPLVARLRRLLC